MAKLARILVAVAASAALATATAVAAAPAQAAPAHSNSKSRVTYLVHGYTPASCAGRWKDLKKAFQTWGWKPSSLRTIGYYASKYQSKSGGSDASCQDRISKSDSMNTRIQTIGRQLAVWVYRHDTVKGRAVNLVGHSMGGLIVRAAVMGVARHLDGFPPRLYVTNAVEIDSPNQGLSHCNHKWRQCRQMLTKSDFLKALPHAPQATGGTDWSLLGSSHDTLVSWRSGVDLGHHAQHKYHYLYQQPAKKYYAWLTHSGMREDYHANRTYHLSYWRTGWSSSKHTTKGWAPLYAVFQACYHAKAW